MTDAQEQELTALFVRALNGDAEAYERCLAALTVELRAYVRARTGRGADAPWIDDVVQETLMSLHHARHTYDARRSFAAWFYTIAKHRLIDEFRSASRRRAKEVAVDLLPEPASVDADPAERDALAHALAQLPPRQRGVITAMKIDGASVREVAARTGLSESAVKITAHRGYKLLRRLLTTRGSDE